MVVLEGTRPSETMVTLGGGAVGAVARFTSRPTVVNGGQPQPPRQRPILSSSS
jgi:hypothetical protein